VEAPSGGLFLPQSASPFEGEVLLLRNTQGGGWSGML